MHTPRQLRGLNKAGFWVVQESDGYPMLMRANTDETAVHSCHYPGDMAVRMR